MNSTAASSKPAPDLVGNPIYVREKYLKAGEPTPDVRLVLLDHLVSVYMSSTGKFDPKKPTQPVIVEFMWTSRMFWEERAREEGEQNEDEAKVSAKN